MADPQDDDLERPTIPFWAKVIVCALAVVGLISIVKWIVSFVLGIVWVLVVIAVILGAAYAFRAASKRKKTDGSSR